MQSALLQTGRFRLILKRLDKLPAKEYFVLIMNTVKAYEEVIDFIAAGTTPQNVIAFRPSEAAQERVTDLLSLSGRVKTLAFRRRLQQVFSCMIQCAA